jgi:hypothetical protein
MTRKLFTCLLILILGISGCNLPASKTNSSIGASAPRAWFDAPLPGTVVRPPNPCQIVAHGASPNGISLFELSVNGAVKANIPSPDTQSSLVTLTQDCGLSEPGEYLLQLRAQDKKGNWSGFAETSLIIAAGETQNGTPPAPTEAATPTTIATPTLIPSPTPTLLPTGGVTIESISTDLVYLGKARCGTLEATITAHATAPKGITVVVLFYRFETGNSSSGFESVAMNPIGGDLYQRTLNPTSLFGGAIPFDQATLQYQVVVQQKDGDTSIRTPVMADIAVRACGTVTLSCSSYTDQRTCIANGCNWTLKPGAVPIYVCKNP